MGRNKFQAIFKCETIGVKLTFNNLDDFKAYLHENPDTKFIMEMTPEDKLTEKQKLYRFYGAVILPLTVRALREHGWDVGTLEADGFLNSQCGKETIVSDSGEELITVTTSKRDDTLARLTQRVNDAVMLLWDKFQMVVPDSEEYLNEVNKTTIRSAKNELYRRKNL